MKTLSFLLVLGVAAPAYAGEPESVLELLRTPGPALKSVLASSAAEPDQLEELQRLERDARETRNTRSIAPSQAEGGRLIPVPGRRVTLR